MNSMRLSTLGAISWLMVAITLVLMLWMDISGRERIGQNASQWQRQVAVQAAKSQALIRLRSAMGFGGLMQHVKEALIGSNDAPLLKILDDVARARRALADYQSNGLSEEESKHAAVVAEILESYRKQAQELDRLLRAGRSATEIARVMPQTDEQTAAALTGLERELMAQESLRRQSIGHSVAEFRDWLLRRTVLLAGSLALALILLSWFIGFRVVGPLHRSARAMASLGTSGAGGQMPEAEHADEIADLTTALGQLNNRMAGFQRVLNQAVSSAVTDDGTTPTSDGAKLVQQGRSLQTLSEELGGRLQQWRGQADDQARSGHLALGEARAVISRALETIRHSRGFLAGLDEVAGQAHMLSLNLAIAAQRDDAGSGSDLATMAADMDRLAAGLIETTETLHGLLDGLEGKPIAEGGGLDKAGDALSAMLEILSEMAGAATRLATASGLQAEIVRRIGESVSAPVPPILVQQGAEPPVNETTGGDSTANSPLPDQGGPDQADSPAGPGDIEKKTEG